MGLNRELQRVRAKGEFQLAPRINQKLA